LIKINNDVLKQKQIMPCSICGGNGHNRRTCPRINHNEPNEQVNIPNEQVNIPNEQVNIPDEPNMEFEDPIITMILTEQYVRNMLITGKINELTEGKIKFLETFLSIQKKEFRIINLEREISFDMYISNDNSNVFETENKEYTYIGKITPRSLDKFITFTGYKYLFNFHSENRTNSHNISEKNILNNVELIIDGDIKDTYILNEGYENYEEGNHFPVYPTFKFNSINKALISSLKMNYLLNQIKRLGGLEDENYGLILDMHEDIEIPDHDDLDLEAGGLPNKLFTNV